MPRAARSPARGRAKSPAVDSRPTSEKALVVVNFKEVADEWGLAKFNELTENGTKSLLLKGAFDPTAYSDKLISEPSDEIKYTTQPRDFKQGYNYHPMMLRDYLANVCGGPPAVSYISWGHSSMNATDKAKAMFQRGATAFVNTVLPQAFLPILTDTFAFHGGPTKEEAADPGYQLPSKWALGHFICGNTTSFACRTPNHFVWTINHVFQLVGQKTWYICAITDAMKMKEFTQNNPMEYVLVMDRDKYMDIPEVFEFVVQAGDYFYNAPLVGHAVGMGPGKNVMLSLRGACDEFVPPPEWMPLLTRTINVTRSVIHGDASLFFKFKQRTPSADSSAYSPTIDVPKYLLGNVSTPYLRWRAEFLYKVKRVLFKGKQQAAMLLALFLAIVATATYFSGQMAKLMR